VDVPISAATILHAVFSDSPRELQFQMAEFSGGRSKGEHPRRHLQHFSGALQADAYSGLHHLYGDGRIYEVACWAHARRKFHDIHVTHRSPITTEVLNRIGALYAIEEQVRGKPPDLRCSPR
jgi:hypothetical protein